MARAVPGVGRHLIAGQQVLNGFRMVGALLNGLASPQIGPAQHSVRLIGRTVRVYRDRMRNITKFCGIFVRYLMVSAVAMGLLILIGSFLLVYVSPWVVAGTFTVIFAGGCTWKEITEERAKAARKKTRSSRRAKRPPASKGAAEVLPPVPAAGAAPDPASVTKTPERRRSIVRV